MEKREGTHYVFWYSIMFLLLAASWVVWGLALRSPIMIKLETDSFPAILRTINWLVLLSFFLILMVRHLVMFALSVGESVSGGNTRGAAAPLEKLGPGTMISGVDAATWQDRNGSLPRVSIIVPAFNEGPCIEATIKALVKISYSNLEVLVVDDGSTDDTLTRASALQGKHGSVEVIVLSKINNGKCEALNFGIERASGEFIAVVDGDSLLQPQSIGSAVKRMRDSTIGAIAGKVIVLNRINILSRLQHIEYIKGLNLHRRAQGFIHAVGIVPGPVGIFRRSAIEEVGGYDNDTFAEDFDLTVKMIKAGWKVEFEPEAVALTEAPESLIPLIKQRYRWTRGILQVLKKHWKSQFLSSSGTPHGRFTLLYFILEGLLMPFLNMLWVSFLIISLFRIDTMSAALWLWLQLVILEMVTTLYCMGEEKNNLLFPLLLVPIERWIYQPLLDTVRVLASIEEFVGVKMQWGKNSRKGRAA